MFVSAEYPVSVGYMLGKQVRSDIKKRGEVVAVLSDKAKWASDRYLEGLQKALTGSSLNLLPPCLESASEDTGALAPGVIEKVHKKNPNATAIVVFLSVPELRDEDKQAGLPPLYVFQRGEAATCKDWIEAGLVSGACFYKEDVNWETVPARMSSLEAAFKDRFKLATPGDLPPAAQGTKEK